MVTRGRQLPDPVRLPPLALDGVPVPTMGWTHAGKAYAFTVQPLGDGKYRAAILSFNTGAILDSWPTEELAQAQAWAAHDYAKAAWGVPDKVTVVRTPKGKERRKPNRQN